MHIWPLLSLLLSMTTTFKDTNGMKSSSTASPAKEPKTKVVVIGAGFAGLSVAYHLREEQNVDVTILEARDRVGGRVHPFVLNDSNNVKVDLGGQWLHEASPKNPLRQLMEDLDLPFVQRQTLPHGAEHDVIYNPDGTLVSKGVLQTAQRIFYKALNEFEVEEVEETTTFQDLLEQQLQLARISDDRLSNLDDADDELQRALNYMMHRTEGYEGGRMNELSAKLAELYQNMGGPDQVPRGTYATVLNAIQDRIIGTAGGSKCCRIRLNTPVSQIAYRKSGVTVKLKDANEKPIHCDVCVCTVPLGVLKQQFIEFDPPLPPARTAAINSIGMGLLNKIVFLFPTCFWKSKGHDSAKRIGIAHDDPAKVKLFYDCTKDVMEEGKEGGVLIQFLAGEAAARVECVDENGRETTAAGLSDDDVVQESLESLRSIFGQDNVPAPTSTAVTRWRQDQFSCGSYSFAKVGATEEMYDEIASPLGNNNLLFAGEHTSKHAHSTVHGAWATGHREAKRIQEMIRATVTQK